MDDLTARIRKALEEMGIEDPSEEMVQTSLHLVRILSGSSRRFHWLASEFRSRCGETCEACARDMPADCPKSERACGHHCECSWDVDECCWCGQEFGEGE